jgi:hypothetical protein
MRTVITGRDVIRRSVSIVRHLGARRGLRRPGAAPGPRPSTFLVVVHGLA